MKPARGRAVVQCFRAGFRVRERRACRVAGVPRSTCRSRSVARDQALLRMRLRDLAAARARYGSRRLRVLLQREGWRVNHKRVHRIDREEGLGIRVQRRRKRVSGVRVLPPPARRPQERWRLDSLADSLVDGRRFRVLTIAESFDGHFRAECLDQHWSASLEEARATVEAWRLEDTTERPHRALGHQTPAAAEAARTPVQEAAG